MYNLAYWKRFNTRTDIKDENQKTVVSNKFTYKISKEDSRHVNTVMYIEDGNLGDIFKKIDEIFKEKKNGYKVVVRETDNEGLRDYLIKKGYKKSVVSENRSLKLNQDTIEAMSEGINETYRLEEKK